MKNLTNSSAPHRLAALTAPLVAVGVLLGGLALGGAAVASAQPADSGGCSAMTMTSGQNGANPSAMTRAGQVASAAGPSASDGSMAVDCRPASHG